MEIIITEGFSTCRCMRTGTLSNNPLRVSGEGLQIEEHADVDKVVLYSTQCQTHTRSTISPFNFNAFRWSLGSVGPTKTFSVLSLMVNGCKVIERDITGANTRN